MQKVQDIMTKEVETCSLLDNIYEAAVKMKENDIGAVPVVDGNRLVGIVTDRDLVLRGYAEKRPGSTKVEEVMTKNLITVSKDQPIHELAGLMADHQIRRVPVVDGSRLVGIVALGDLAAEKKADYRAKAALSKISEETQGEKRIY